VVALKKISILSILLSLSVSTAVGMESGKNDAYVLKENIQSIINRVNPDNFYVWTPEKINPDYYHSEDTYKRFTEELIVLRRESGENKLANKYLAEIVGLKAFTWSPTPMVNELLYTTRLKELQKTQVRYYFGDGSVACAHLLARNKQGLIALLQLKGFLNNNI